MPSSDIRISKGEDAFGAKIALSTDDKVNSVILSNTDSVYCAEEKNAQPNDVGAQQITEIRRND